MSLSPPPPPPSIFASPPLGDGSPSEPPGARFWRLEAGAREGDPDPVSVLSSSLCQAAGTSRVPVVEGSVLAVPVGAEGGKVSVAARREEISHREVAAAATPAKESGPFLYREGRAWRISRTASPGEKFCPDSVDPSFRITSEGRGSAMWMRAHLWHSNVTPSSGGASGDTICRASDSRRTHCHVPTATGLSQERQRRDACTSLPSRAKANTVPLCAGGFQSLCAASAWSTSSSPLRFAGRADDGEKSRQLELNGILR